MYTHMKKNRKLLLFTVSLLFTFFGFINKVSAVSTCYYALPFSSYDYIRDEQYNFSIPNNATDEVNWNGQIMTGNYPATRLSKPLEGSSGFMMVSVDYDKKKYYFTPWTSYEKSNVIPFPDAQDSSIFKDKCPKYISITGEATFEEATKNDYSKFLKSQDYADLLSSRNNGDYFNSMIIDIQSGKKVILPIYFDSYKGSQNYDYEAVKIYNDIYTQKWKTLLEKNIGSMKTSCGNDWSKYINISKNNYPEFDAKQGPFIKYAIFSEDRNSGIDANASEECKKARAKYLRTWLSFYDYWATMLNGYIEVSGKKLCISNAKSGVTFPSQCVYMADIFSRYTSFFNEATDSYNVMVNSGTERALDTRDAESLKIQEFETKIKTIDKYLNVLNSDLCSGLCATSLNESDLSKSINFDNCISTKQTTHDSCYTKLDSCKKDACGSCQSMSGTAKDGCLSSCNNELNQCMIKAGYEVALNNRRTKIESLEEMKKQLQDEISGIKESKVYTYSDDPLAQIEWRRKKYTPQCKDIKVITYLWSIIKYTAPFLVIIFTGFDYFKVVMAADEAAMKKIKKSIPKRLIAFLLLLIIPLLLKIFIGMFPSLGSNRLGYLKCILTDDTTSGSEENNDNNSKNTESNKSN